MFTTLLRSMAAIALLAPMSAMAIPITVDFTIQGVFGDNDGSAPFGTYNGYDATTTGSGWLTFDDAIGNFEDQRTGVAPSDFQLDFAGLTFTEVDVRLHYVHFIDGDLFAWAIGHDGEGDCGLVCLMSAGPTDLLVHSQRGTGTTFVTRDGVNGYMRGALVWTIRTTPVPEPATLGLLGLGLVGALALRRRRIA